MRNVVGLVVGSFASFYCAAHHGEPLVVGVYQKTEKLSVFIPRCGHDRRNMPMGSFFVVANPDVRSVLEAGYSSEKERFIKHVAASAVLLKDAKAGYDGVVFFSGAVEINFDRQTTKGVHIPCT